MRQHVEIGARIPGQVPEEVFEVVRDFERWPQLAPDVEDVRIIKGSGNRSLSEWKVHFRGGLLCWTEEDVLDEQGLEVVFRQTEGDLAEFAGRWSVTQDGDGHARVTAVVDFDFGIPSLAELIDPVAVRTLANTIRSILDGLFGHGLEYEVNVPEASAAHHHA